MPSSAEVTYIDIKLNSIPSYWAELVVPDIAEFRLSPSPRSVFQSALSVWHLHEWVWQDRNPGKTARGAEFETFRNGVVTSCRQLGWLRDISDARKHRGPGRLPAIEGAEPEANAWSLCQDGKEVISGRSS